MCSRTGQGEGAEDNKVVSSGRQNGRTGGNAWLSLIAADKALATAPATKDGDFVFFFGGKISDSESKALIEKVRQHFLKPYRRMAEIVFRSDSPDEEPSFLNTFTASFGVLQKILYMDVSIVVNEKLLFTTCETSWLFCLDPQENSLEIIFDFSFISYGASRFVSIISYGDELWFIPGHEDEIFIYTPDRKEMELLRFPGDLSKRMGKGVKFSSVLRDGEVLWLVPQELRKVISVNMRDRSMKLYEDWPEGVTFIDRKPCSNDFNCGWLMDDKLYMMASGCSANICFDTKQGGMSTWAKKDGYPRYGNYLDGKVYISPRLSGDYIRTGIDGTGVIEDPLPGELWAGIPEDSKEHRWWYVTETTRFIIFLPYISRYILLLEKGNDRLKTVYLLDHDYRNCYIRKETFSGYAAHEICGEIWITQHRGASIIRLDSNGDFQGIIDLSFPLDKLPKKPLRSAEPIKREAVDGQLDDWLRSVCTKSTLRIEED